MIDASVSQSMLSLIVGASCASFGIWAFASKKSSDAGRAPSPKVQVVIGTAFSACAIAFLVQPLGAILPVYATVALSAVVALICAGAAAYLWHEIVTREAPNITASDYDLKNNKVMLVRAVDEARRRLRDIAEISGDWIWQTDERGELTYISEGIRNVQGLQPTDYLGRGLFDIAETDPGSSSIATREQLIAQRQPFRNIILQCRDNANDLRIIRLSGSPLTNEAGDYCGYHGLGSDITSEYRLQEQRATASAKDMFLASMSHEIRTPLNGVLGILEILSETTLSGDQKNLVSTASESGESLLHLINDVLDFSKIQAGRFQLATAPEDLAFVLRASVDALKPLAAKHDNTISLEFSGSCPRSIIVDAQRYRQIAVNLIGNAIKFTRAGTITVNVRCIPIDSTKITIRTSVTDTGIGIPQSRIGLLFKEFSMLEDPSRINTSGTGLGLALSKKLTEAMGGKIGVDSTEGQGSTFWFEANFELGTEVAEPAASIVTQPASTAAQRRLNVLLAEDNPTNALVTKRMLDSERYTLKLVTNGQEAVDAFKAETFDIILMDVSMPVMDGMTATDNIRKLERRSRSGRIPIIALTAHAIVSERERILKSGMTSLISKPVRKQMLLDEIAKLVPAATDLPVASAVVPKATAVEPVAVIIEKPLAAPIASMQTPVAPKPTAFNKRLESYGPILDVAVMHALAEETGHDVFPDLMDVFRSEMANRANQLKIARDSANVELLMTTCHALAGSTATIGAKRLHILCKQIENACRAKKDAKFLAIINNILSEIDLLLANIPDLTASPLSTQRTKTANTSTQVAA